MCLPIKHRGVSNRIKDKNNTAGRLLCRRWLLLFTKAEGMEVSCLFGYSIILAAEVQDHQCTADGQQSCAAKYASAGGRTLPVARVILGNVVFRAVTLRRISLVAVILRNVVLVAVGLLIAVIVVLVAVVTIVAITVTVAVAAVDRFIAGGAQQIQYLAEWTARWKRCRPSSAGSAP